MSRGFGTLQKQILSKALTLNLPISVNQLLWLVAAENNQISRSNYSVHFNSGSINHSFYKSFQRAISQLRNNKKIEILAYRLTSLDEVISVYPYLTRNNLIKEIRLAFLPFIKEYIDRYPGNRIFSLSEVEDFSFKEMKKNDSEKYFMIRDKWLSIQNKLINLIDNNLDEELKSYIIQLLAKGEQFFSDSKVIINLGAQVIINNFLSISENKILKIPDLRTALLNFIDESINTKELSHAKMKNQLYNISYFYKRSSSSLKEEFAEELLRKYPEQISNLKESRIIDIYPRKEEGVIKIMKLGVDNIFDPIINKLISKDVFSRFKFITRIN